MTDYSRRRYPLQNSPHLSLTVPRQNGSLTSTPQTTPPSVVDGLLDPLWIVRHSCHLPFPGVSRHWSIKRTPWCFHRRCHVSPIVDTEGESPGASGLRSFPLDCVSSSTLWPGKEGTESVPRSLTKSPLQSPVVPGPSLLLSSHCHSPPF